MYGVDVATESTNREIGDLPGWWVSEAHYRPIAPFVTRGLGKHALAAYEMSGRVSSAKRGVGRLHRRPEGPGL
ncbi:MAG: hypothetical protein DMG01_06570 [Acidobacteria bacterium]|nr:MAG: hypothetical protein DMG01_06570 [Acidobacteriota bacterium]